MPRLKTRLVHVVRRNPRRPLRRGKAYGTHLRGNRQFTEMRSPNPVPERYAREYLERAPSLVWLILTNLLAVLVGVDYYVATMAGVSPFLWPLYTDSPAALLLMTLSLVTLLPNLGDRLEDVPHNRPLAYLHTFAFVWLVKYGLWTAVALNLGFEAYYPEIWSYWGILITHLAFILEAFLIPRYARTTKGALVAALALLLVNDVVDYGFGLHPPIRYPPGVVLPAVTVGLSVGVVALAWLLFDRA